LGADTVVKYLGIGDQQWWDLSTVDAAGIVTSTTPAVVVTVEDPTVISSINGTSDLVKIQGLKAGSTTFTIKDAATGLLVLGPVTVNVSAKSAASATFTLDKGDYALGEAFTLTITAKDVNGLPLADGLYTDMASLSASSYVYTSSGIGLGTAQYPIFVGGVSTIKGFMPANTASVTFKLCLQA